GCDLDNVRVQGCDHSYGVLFDNSQEDARCSLRLASMRLPILDRIEAKAEGIGETGLSEAEPIADCFDIDLTRHMDLEPLGLAGQVCFDLVQSSHHLFKCSAHISALSVRIEYLVGTLLESIPFCLGKVGLLAFRKTCDEQYGVLWVTKNVNNACTPAFSSALPRNAHLAKSSGS